MNFKKDNLGFYIVGWQKFYNKTLALIESKKVGYDPIWIFNDDIYSKIDWTIPINRSLADLYKERAQQLREQYDYIILYFSGGADSLNVLNAFVENNIFVDEIIMLIPEPDRKNFKDGDTSGRNLYGEIEYVAIPYINSIRNILNPNTKITLQDFSASVIEIVKKDDWVENFVPGLRFTPGGLGWQYLDNTVPSLLKLANTGKTICKLYGVDKPVVLHKDGDYYAYFVDTNAYHACPTELTSTKNINDDVSTELFYWTPSLPEIVIKQAQLIKLHCELDPLKKQLWSETKTRPVGDYRQAMHPIIYPGIGTPKFQTEKVPMDIFKPSAFDAWFWETISPNSHHNYVEALSFIGNSIKPDHLNNNESIVGGYKAITSKLYKL